MRGCLKDSPFVCVMRNFEKNGGNVLEVVKGYVDHIVYRNADNGYTVFHLTNEDGEITCVGTFSYIHEGEMLEVSGEYTNHNVYGLQLQVASYEIFDGILN